MIATEYCKKVFDGTHDSPKPVENGRLLITSKHIANRNLDISSAYLISEEDFENVNKRSQVHQWDILFSMIGTVGNVYIETSEKIDYAIKNMGVFSCQNKEKAYWLYYYLQSPLVQAKIDALMAGAVQKFVPLGFLRDLDIPEYTENSKKVVQVLSALDDKIALNKKMNQKLEAMAKRLYDYWFVQYDFPDKNGLPYKTTGGPMTYNPTLKREIPAGWEVKTLKECIKHINTGLNPRDNFVLGNGDIKYVTVKNLTTEGNIDFSGCDLIDEDALKKVHKRSDIAKGDVLYASICPLGRSYLINKDPIGWDINESVFSIRPNLDVISSEFLSMFLKDSAVVEKASKMATGSIFKGIRIKELENMIFAVPAKNVMESFSKQIKNLIELEHKNIEETTRLTALRDKLLPLLMNGQVVVG